MATTEIFQQWNKERNQLGRNFDETGLFWRISEICPHQGISIQIRSLQSDFANFEGKHFLALDFPVTRQSGIGQTGRF